MKHYAFMLGLVIAVCIAACNKYDGPLPSEKRQLTYFEIARAPFHYIYDKNRLLTQLYLRQGGLGPNFLFTYDALKRPLTMKDSIGVAFDKFIYENGRLTRIDQYFDGSTVSRQVFFTYDGKGRITRKDGMANNYDYVKYEYEGNSLNFKKALYYSYPVKPLPTEPPASLIEEYTYDNEVNPFNTFINFQVVPLHWSNYWGPIFYEPVTPNNIRNLKTYGKVDTGYFQFMEFDFTYVYDHHYPVSHNFRRRDISPSGGPGSETNYPGIYIYEKIR